MVCVSYLSKAAIKNFIYWDFPGGPVGKTLCSQCGGPGSIPGQGTRSHIHAATKSSHAATKDPACCN